MRRTMIPIVVSAFEIVSKVLKEKLKELEIRGRILTIQIIILLRSTRILRKILKTCGDGIT